MYNVMKFQAPFERLKEYNTSAEVILYKAIITQAIIDSTNISECLKAKALAKDAKSWIFENSDYFQKICYLANIEPSFVIKITQEAIRLNQKKLLTNSINNKRKLRSTKKNDSNRKNLELVLDLAI